MTERAQQLHLSQWSGVFYITGGGSELLSEMLQEPGASNTVLEGTVPYSERSLGEVLGGAPDQACSMPTARALAMAGYEKAILHGGSDYFGFGCTASLATNREKKGQHRAHWAIQTAKDTFCYSAVYSADRVTEEEQLLEDLWDSIDSALLSKNNSLSKNVEHKRANASDDWSKLLNDKTYRHTDSGSDGLLLLPGSFNPMHRGHQKMLQNAEKISQLTGAFEISIKNAEKPSLDYLTLSERLEQMQPYPVWVTNAATFVEKSRLFPSCTFVVGVDTIKRIGEARFYNNESQLMDTALKELKRNKTRFLVYGRVQGQHFESLKDLTLPDSLFLLCEEVPENQFRLDLSSTQLRQDRLNKIT